MEDGEAWIMRPVLSGLCRYESLLDGSIGLHDLVRMHEALDVHEENQYRIAKSLNGK